MLRRLVESAVLSGLFELALKQAKQISDLTAANNPYRQTMQTLAGISIDAKKSADTASAAARVSDVVADRMRKQFDQYVAAARHSAATGGGAPAVGGTDALDLLTGLFNRADQAAGELAKFARCPHRGTCLRAQL